MRILVLSYFFEPDLSAGSFRNTNLVKALDAHPEVTSVHVITTEPNRYQTYTPGSASTSFSSKVKIDRIAVPVHQNGFADQIKSFLAYFRNARRLTKAYEYDVVYASTAKQFTAFLGKVIANRKKTPVFLDVRDIFVDSLKSLFKGKSIYTPARWLIRWAEYFTFHSADHINLVSEGFKGYFGKYKKPTYSYFTNGIDDEFLPAAQPVSVNDGSNRVKKIVYAGNIGEGQGLHIIVPKAAKELEGQAVFEIIGDGGAKNKLIDALKEAQVTNVQFLPPQPRKSLIQHYADADFLFVHLNDFDAYKKVLPSKIFEYAAFDKPIIAGVAGYSAEFLRTYVDNILLFNPGDAAEFIRLWKNYKYRTGRREEFIRQFTREAITRRLAEEIVRVAKG